MAELLLCANTKSYNHQPKPIAQKKKTCSKKPRLRSKGNLQINKNVHGATLKKTATAKIRSTTVWLYN
jgi:hypothetical protein